MVARATTTALLLGLAACGGASDDPPEDVVVFRIGAAAGLPSLLPGPRLQGSSAAAAELVFEPREDFVSELRAEGARVMLTRRSSSRLTAKELASYARYDGLVTARAIDADHVELVLSDARSAAGLVQYGNVGFDIGPFEVESHGGGRARLRRRGKSAIDVIEIVEVSRADEWRKLMARELDAIPSTPNLYRSQFAGLASVRLIDIAPTNRATLYFNVNDPVLADRRVRHRIAASIDRPAIARVASGESSHAVPAIKSDPLDPGVLPSHLSLITVEGLSTHILAASVLRHQLDQFGIAVDVEPLNLQEVLKRIAEGRHQLVLTTLPVGDARFARFLSPNSDNASVSGFSDPEYDAAVAAGDLGRAQAILDREVPATSLYESYTFAAVDSRFCGDVRPKVSSWRWIANLRPCEGQQGKQEDKP